MRQVGEKLFVGSEKDCGLGWPTVHACKHPCHQSAVGYTKNLPKDHPNYLILETDTDLYLNLVDSPFPVFTPEIFEAVKNFIDRQTELVMIHCNQGQSRAPALAMYYLAAKGYLSQDNYEDALKIYQTIDPINMSSRGIQLYLRFNWRELVG